MDDEDFIPLDQVPAYIDGLIQKSNVLAAQNERLRGDMDARFKTIDRLSDDLKELREQNRVLRSNLVNCVARLEAYYGEDYPAVRDAKAALDGGKGVQGWVR